MDLSLFEDPEFREAFRSLDANLSVVRTEPDPQHPTRPIIHFYGEMQDPSTSTMTGSVKMTADNQVQWHFVGLFTCMGQSKVLMFMNILM